MGDKRIFGDTADMLRRLLSEMLVKSRKSDFTEIFCNFISSARQYIETLDENDPQCGEMEFKLLELLSGLKSGEEKMIFGQKKIVTENAVNELIYSTLLNEVKAENNSSEIDSETNRLYDIVKAVIFFDIKEVTENSYGFWCFLKIAFLLKEIYGSSKNNIIDDNLRLNNIKDETLRFVFGKADGDSAELLYNYGGNGTFEADRTAIYLKVCSIGKSPVFYVMKTENRVPKKEDILNLHLQRDSLRTMYKGKSCILFSGVYILFPAENSENSEKSENDFIYGRALSEGVGAIPFSPENTAYAADIISKIAFYDDAVNTAPVTSALKDVLEKYEIECRNVLLVTVKSKEQLEINIKNGFYYMPAEKISTPKFAFEYIAVYQSANLFGKAAGIMYYGKIEEMSLVRRRDITEIPRDSGELYYRFKINWKTLENKINPTGTVRAFALTSLYLLIRAKNVSELFIQNYDEYLTLEFFKSHVENAYILGDEEGIYGIAAGKIRLEFTNYGVILYNNGKEIFSADRIFYRKNLKFVHKKIAKEVFGAKD